MKIAIKSEPEKCVVCLSNVNTKSKYVIQPCKCNTYIHCDCAYQMYQADATIEKTCPVCRESYIDEVQRALRYKKIIRIIGIVIGMILLLVLMYSFYGFDYRYTTNYDRIIMDNTTKTKEYVYLRSDDTVKTLTSIYHVIILSSFLGSCAVIDFIFRPKSWTDDMQNLSDFWICVCNLFYSIIAPSYILWRKIYTFLFKNRSGDGALSFNDRYINLKEDESKITVYWLTVEIGGLILLGLSYFIGFIPGLIILKSMENIEQDSYPFWNITNFWSIIAVGSLGCIFITIIVLYNNYKLGVSSYFEVYQLSYFPLRSLVGLVFNAIIHLIGIAFLRFVIVNDNSNMKLIFGDRTYPSILTHGIGSLVIILFMFLIWTLLYISYKVTIVIAFIYNKIMIRSPNDNIEINNINPNDNNNMEINIRSLS